VSFLTNALIAGSAVAVPSGLLGWFVLMRRQVFAGDALGHVAFTGALAAAAFGVDVRVGLFVGTVGLACVLAVLGRRARADDVVIGATFALVLGLGVLFLARLSRASGRGGDAGLQAEQAAAAARSLFGSVLGLTTADALVLAAVGLVVSAGLVALARPLLFSGLDPERARARGVRERLVGLLFLVLVGVAAGQASQAVGALLALGLLVAPAAAAHRLTARPYLGPLLAAAIGLVATWAGLALSKHLSGVPASAAVVLCATAASVLAGVARWLRSQPSVAAFAGRGGGDARASQTASAEERVVRVDLGPEPGRQLGDGS
jgi:zinc/manganese transport system permease protein